jgi:chorismate dehydratase
MPERANFTVLSQLGNPMRISVVSYLNSAPLVQGILGSGLLSDCSVTLDIPSEGARKLASGEADIALVPVGAFAGQSSVHWIGNYCIGVEGPVRTVCLFSQVPLNEVRKVWLDPHSRTSVRLIRILARHHWQVEWEFMPAEEGFEKEKIRGNEAGLCIGDKVFSVEGKFPYKYDLAENWIAMTGLPFVFAGWASLKPVPEEMTARLDRAQESGIRSLDQILPELSRKYGLPEPVIRNYLTKNISYPLTEIKKKGMELFITMLTKKEG